MLPNRAALPSIAFALAAVFAVAGCSPKEEPASGPAGQCPIGTRFVGSPNLPVELVAGLSVDGVFHELHDGDDLPMVTPPQGGHVSFVAVRVRNVDPCGLKVRARVRSPRTMQLEAEEERSISFDEIDDAGWAAASLDDIANFANIPMCPDYGDDSLVDQVFTLEVRALDATKREASLSRSITPRCQQKDAYENALCRCECSADYTLGRCADPLDGGWLADAAADAVPDAPPDSDAEAHDATTD